MLKLSLRNRFILYFLPLLAAVLLLGVFCILTFAGIHNQFHAIQQEMSVNAAAMLDLKGLFLALEDGIREKRINRPQLLSQVAQLKRQLADHTSHAHLQTDASPSRPSHDMLHHAIMAVTLSDYILGESSAGWPRSEYSQLAIAAFMVQQELSSLEALMDQHLQQHLEQLAAAEAFVSVRYERALTVVALISIGAALLTVFVFALMLRSVLGPVRVLQEGTRHIRAGRFNFPLAIRSGDEFEFLAREFASMAQHLSRHHEELESKVQERTHELTLANSELRRAEEQVHQLSQELLAVQEKERQQIALHLHDHVAQELSSLKIAGGAMADSPAKAEAAQEWVRQLDRCIKTVRELSYTLRPPGLEQIGLSSALADCCRSFSRRTGIPVQFLKAGVDQLPIEADAAINIYRIVQEGLTNIGRHAQASKAELRLIASGASLILRLEDNGCGFSLEAGQHKAISQRRLGLLGMQERVRMLGGSIRISSAPGQGTRIHVEVPGLMAAPGGRALNENLSQEEAV